MRWSEEQYQEYLEKSGRKSARQEPPKKNKYNAKHTWTDGVCFDSQKEASYYEGLKLLHRAGELAAYCLQPKFILVEGDGEHRAITWSADFIKLYKDGTYEVVDTKGFQSEQWKRVLKQIELKYPGLKLTVI